MSNESSSSASVQVGPGLLGCLTILFVILKVTGYISWSWWWVFSPLIFGAAVWLTIMAVMAVFFFLALKHDRRRF